MSEVRVSGVVRREYKRGKEIFAENSQPCALYRLCSGLVMRLVVRTDAKAIGVGLIFPDQYFGEEFLFDATYTSAAVVISRHACIEVITRPSEAQTGEAIVGAISQLRYLQAMYTHTTVLGRVQYLQSLIGGEELHGLRREDIAALVAASREMVSREMSSKSKAPKKR